MGADSKKDKMYAREGVPKKEISWRRFNKLCEEQCTMEDIAYELEVSPDTIERRIKEKYDCTFAELFEIKRRPGLRSLRNRTYKEAMKGNPTMLIWLEKKYKKKIDIASDAEDKSRDINIEEIKITFVDSKNKEPEEDEN